MFLILNGCLMHYTLADLGCDMLDHVTLGESNSINNIGKD